MCILTTMCFCACRLKSEKTFYNIEQNRAAETPEGPLLLSAHERTKRHMLGDLQFSGEDVVVSRKGQGGFAAICWWRAKEQNASSAMPSRFQSINMVYLYPETRRNMHGGTHCSAPRKGSQHKSLWDFWLFFVFCQGEHNTVWFNKAIHWIKLILLVLFLAIVFSY